MLPRSLRLPVLLLLTGASCSTSLSEEEVAARDEFYSRAVQYYDVGRYAQSEQQARMGLKVDEDDAMLNLIAGRAILMQATLPHLATALPYLEQALDDLPDDQRDKASFSLAQYHLIYGRELQTHVQRARRALDQNPNPDAQTSKEERARLDEREGRAREHYDEAARYAAEAVEAAPDSLQHLEIQGQIAALRGDDVLAFAALNRALELLGESRTFLNRTLGFSTELPVGEEQRLRSRLLSDIQREIAVRGVMASLYKRQGRLPDEEQQYTLMLQLDERLSTVYYSRGMVRHELGRIPEAAADMREFLMRTDLDPGAAQVAEAVNILHEHERLQPEPRGAN